MSFFMRLFLSVVLLAPSLASAATLETPGNGDNLSGIGVIRGWKCEAVGDITVRFDGGDSVALVYGNERGDTAGVCGDTTNGFVAVYNWALLDDGEHTVVAYDNGVEFARSTFEVTTLGTPFLQGASREVTVFDFPELGTDVVLEWQPALQNFVITDRVESSSGAPSGSRLYWADTTGEHDTVYWARTDRSAAGSISIADDVQGFIGDFAIDAVEDKLYFLIYTEEGGAIHRVNLDGTQYEEVWVYQSPTDMYGPSIWVGEISLDERGNIYLSISDTNAWYDVAELKRFNIEEAVSYPGDGPPVTHLTFSDSEASPPNDFALQTVWDTAQIESLFGRDDIPPQDLHIIGDTMYFHVGHPTSILYRARTDGSGVRREYGHYSDEPYSSSGVRSLEVRDSTLWWVSEEWAPDATQATRALFAVV